ncbi:hypothetical protein J6TS2_15940 [Heyndrickxia sporothermodurans]|nr:hypothetical protein J6TS2_15940 [Heyndrickxia sporothermodurans]
MRIGEFLKIVNATKDTVRHYEDLGLLEPKWEKTRKNYEEKEVKDYQTIIELKKMGFSLKDIQLIFQLKKTLGCGNKDLVYNVYTQLNEHLSTLKKEEWALQNRRKMLEHEIEQLKQHLDCD